MTELNLCVCFRALALGEFEDEGDEEEDEEMEVGTEVSTKPFTLLSIADPDPGSGVFFDAWIQDPGWVQIILIGDEHPRSYF